MNKRIEILRIINNLMLVYVIVTIFLRGLGIPGTAPLYFGNLALLGFVLASELIQAFVSNLVFFLLAHLGALAVFGYLSLILPGEGASKDIMLIIRVFVMVILTIIAIISRIDGKGRAYPGVPEAFLFPVLYIFCRIIKCPGAEPLALIGEVIWAVLCIVYYNARQTLGTLVAFKERDYVPYEAIKKNNGMMVRFAVAVSLITMFVVSLFDYGEELLSLIKSGILAILRWIFSFFSFEPESSYEAPESEPVSGGMGNLLPENYEDDSIWHTLWQILYWVIAAAVAILIVFLAVKLVKEFYKLFNASRKGIKDRLSRDKVEFLNPFNEEKDSWNSEKSKKLGIGKRLTKEGRIRAMFVKYVKAGSNYSEVKLSQTPREMEKVAMGPARRGILAGASDQDKEKEASAYRLYDKARYSSMEITSEDIRQMKIKCYSSTMRSHP